MNPEDFEKFEKTILDGSKTGPIKYTVDKSIEASVKFEFLCDAYGQERVENIMQELGIKFTDLSDSSKLKEISEKISENND